MTDDEEGKYYENVPAKGRKLSGSKSAGELLLGRFTTLH